MYRKITKYLIDWKKNTYRKPLILQGARQVGKTYSVLEFGREHYENVVYFNFETNPTFIETFEESIEPAVLIPILSRIASQTIIKEKTLIVFDEVQFCERALTSLKYFCENAHEYHIIVAGSLLGVAVNRQQFSFPVGKVDIKTLYPMDMEEFLLACGEEKLISQIKQCFDKNLPMPTALHETAMKYYRQYLVVGGMPDCVKKFLETKDYILVRHTQSMILVSELNDFKGGMVENYVCNQLTVNEYTNYYWESDRGAEVDFIIQRNSKIIPIEVKSADNTKAKSLKIYMDMHNPEYAIKLSTKNFGFDDNKKIVPLYAAFCI